MQPSFHHPLNLISSAAALGAVMRVVCLHCEAAAAPPQPQPSLSFLRSAPAPTQQDEPPPKLAQDPVADANPLPGVQPLPTSDAQFAQLLASLDEDSQNEEKAIAPTEVTDVRPWRLTPEVKLNSVYDDNIFIAHADRQSDWIIRPSAGFQFTSGDVAQRVENFLNVEYLAGGVFFLDHRLLNSFEQSAEVGGQYRTANLSFGLDTHFRDYSNESIDLGNRDRTRDLQNTASAKYDVSEKTFVEGEFGLNVEDYASEIDSTEYVVKAFAGYKLTDLTSLQFGGATGWLEVHPGGVQHYQQLLARLARIPSEKISLTAEGGVEFREFPGVSSQHITPVFLFNASYEPVKETMLNLSVYRKVENSALLAGQDYIHTGLSGSVSRKFADRYIVALAGGYEALNYENGASTAGVSRRDQYYFIEPSFGVQISRFVDLKIFARFMQDSSNFENFSFRDRQIGLEARISF